MKQGAGLFFVVCLLVLLAMCSEKHEIMGLDLPRQDEEGYFWETLA